MGGRRSEQQLKIQDYEDLQFYGQAMCNPHSSREQERGRQEAPAARRSR